MEITRVDLLIKHIQGFPFIALIAPKASGLEGYDMHTMWKSTCYLVKKIKHTIMQLS